jgi:outer membrane lipoprotein-sorting protein
MRTTRRFLIVLGLIFTLPVLAGAQGGTNQPDPLELLQNVQTTYGAMTSFSAKTTMHMEMNGTGMQVQSSMASTIQIDSSGRMRMESAGPIGMTVVNDGTNIWTYMPQANRYFKMPEPASASAEAGGAIPPYAMGCFGELKNVAKNVKDAKVLRSETVQANGAKVSCWVISVEYEKTGNDDQGNPAEPSPTETDPVQQGGTAVSFHSVGNANTKTLWIGKTDLIVYREDRTDTMVMLNTSETTHFKTSTTYDNITVDQPIPQSAFIFTPPAGATEMQLPNPTPNKTPSKQP